MKKNIPIIIIVVLLIAAGIYLWEDHAASASLDNGIVTSRDGSNSKARMDQGAVDIDGKPMNDDSSSAPRPVAQVTTVNPPATPAVAGTTSASTSAAASTQPVTTGTTQPGGSYQSTGATYQTASLPTNDTLTPNAPSGMAFGGSGKFQWYRQGNLTWRINTQSGSSCIAFATMDEWAKPIVYQHGCGNA